jgi:Carbohydrate-selective porin, OprB family
MTKLSSQNLLSLIPIGLLVLMAGISPSKANTANTATKKVTPTTSTQPESLKVNNSLMADLATEPTSEQLEQAAQSRKIKPGDWAYTTLQALDAKYGCSDVQLEGKTLSRKEFSSRLSDCVQSIEELVARKPRKKTFKKRRVVPAAAPIEAPTAAPEPVAPPAPVEPVAPVAPVEPEPVEAAEAPVTQQDLDRLRSLVQSFSSDLVGVDSRLTTLEKKNFSATTKLVGEVIIGVNGYGGVREIAAAPAVGTTPAVAARPATGNVLTDRVRLNFDTSFTGNDRLRTRLQSRNNIAFNAAVTGTSMTQLGFDGDSQNNTSVSLLQYSFPISDQTKIIAETIGSEFNENMLTFNPLLASSGEGSISRFGRFNPVYRLSGDGASLTVNHKFSDELGLAVGYAIPGGNAVANPAAGAGLFNGSNSIISQLSYLPSKDFNLGLIYARSYSPGGIAGGTGSAAANSPFGAIGTTANHYSVLASYKPSPGFVVSGWAGFIDAKRENPAGAAAATGTANVSNYALSLGFPDFGQKGNNLAFIVGVPPKLNSRSTTTGTAAAVTTTGNPDTSYHIEALYKIKLSDNLAITPGLLLITSPEHNSANATEYVGTIRTTFKF